MATNHQYTSKIVWTGNLGTGTNTYRGYERTWEIRTPGKPAVSCSNDPLLGGNPELHNPEDLLLSALASCHMLWYLHLASNAGIAVSAYEDFPLGFGETEKNGAGRFLQATLRPKIVVPMGTNLKEADAIHREIHKYCYIARSVAFPISYEATYREQ
ncbi:OsmC family protein [uncultured Roseibium sp.]|uniref:OsmC family protein n=1 Tax=uncultured Roseibium sp. TaxID=1936171 RepID=UPI002605059F|nr:OsmC family protein [uncultured Roseibium sp.]